MQRNKNPLMYFCLFISTMGNAAARGKTFYDSILPNNSTERQKTTAFDVRENLHVAQKELLSLDKVDLHYQSGILQASESARKASVLLEHEDVCSEILPEFLYVSNFTVAKDVMRLCEMGISHVISCCSELDADNDDGNSFVRLRLALEDNMEEILTPFFHIVMQFIDKAKQTPASKVLIYCHQGVSRSCALAIAYVMYTNDSDYQDSADIVKKKRAICNPNAAFTCQLMEWQREVARIRDVRHNRLSNAEAMLFRLAPHAAHDANCWLLKPCLYPNSRKQICSQMDGPNQANASIPFTRGVYCILDTQQVTVTIYSSSNCVISNPHAKARQLLEPILATYYREKRHEIRLHFIQDQVNAKENAAVQRFTPFLRDELYQYDLELEWFQRPTITKESKVSHQRSSLSQLFVLESNWEQVSDYDVNDLRSETAAIIMDAKICFLWIGAQCCHPIMKLCNDTTEYCTEYGITSPMIIQHDGRETDAFWSVFERGY